MLNFVKIEVRGFKSFADKVEIPFKEGVTAIIGPNGCGKSNVSDAIRWTLGELSAKQLRGKSMQDVIFAGTEKRRSMSYCEVSLTFNNENQRLFHTLPFDEVIFTRKLDRSGLSEYYLNNSRCNRSDIIALIRDTGIGKEGYSIIGQGRVDEIMSAKPDDRRHIFEEAAGISKNRADRNEAERKLEKTKLNLQTVNEVIAEIEKQINPLRKQAEAAQKYFDLTEKLKYNEVNLYLYNYDNTEDKKQKIQNRINQYDKELRLKNMEYQECERKYDDCIITSGGIDRLYDEYNAELTALKVDAARFEGEANVVKERISHIQSEIKRLNDELTSVDNRLGIQEQLIRSTNEKKDEELRSSIQASKELAEVEAKLVSLTSALDGQESDLDARNREYIKAIEDLGELKANISGLQVEKEINESRAKTLFELLNQKKARLDEELTNLAIHDGNVKAAKERMRQITTEYNETLSEKLEAQEAVKSFEEDIKSLETKRVFAEGNLKLEMQIKSDYSGYQEAVKKLMRDSEGNPMLASKIWGVLAEVIEVPSEYETAIEYALGGAMQNILVETETDARDLINYLKQKNYGRVTFRAHTSCRPHSLAGENMAVLNEQGCCGIASNLIHCDKKFDRFISSLLGTTVIVRTVDDAIRIFRKYNQSFKIVTLDGEVFSKSGEITGGSRRSTNGLLSQDRKIEQLRESLERVKKNIATTTALITEKQAEVASCEQSIDSLNKEIAELRINVGVSEERAKQAFDVTEALQNEIRQDAEEYENVKAQIKELANKLASVDTLERLVTEKKGEYENLVVAKSENSKQKSERETVSQQFTELRVKVMGIKTAMDSLSQELFRLGREKSELEDEKLDIIARLKSEQNKLDNITSAPERTEFSKEDEIRIAKLEKDIAELSERKRTISDEIVAIDKRKSALYDERTVLTEKKTRDEGMLENVDIDLRNQQEYILDVYGLTYTDALEFKDEEFKAYGAQTEITELKRARNRLGEVNQLAVQTLKETEERLAEQVTQRDDIQKAYDDIYIVIQALTEDMQQKFSEAFEKINENFKDVFSQLFGGGKGELRLDTKETDDVLEAGIDIFAQPPGKKLQNIGLLSGGERALTAIAILFAILRLKPMPFCVLDEIEAALDDANVNLFAEFLKKFSDYTQFIVITHRKPTMRHADTIFGVTMEEKGVTKIVSIEFEEAVKHAK